MQIIPEIQEEFKQKLENEDFVIDKNGGKVIEILGATFLADEKSIFVSDKAKTSK